jgi:4-hydroxymandelate oxidase
MDALSRLLTVDDFERAARARLPRTAWDYFRSGAGEERTLRRNRTAFARYQIWPRVLVDVSARDLSTTVLGQRVPFPILIAPTAYHCLAHPDGELATARAAAGLETVYVVSTLATRSLEEVAQAAPSTERAPKWLQLYVQKDRGLTRAIVERAVAVGHTALVLTVDTPILGRRLRDERNGFGLPAGMRMANLDAGGDPGASTTLADHVARRHDASFCWRDLEWLRSLAALPIVLKGILRADDARRAVDSGVAGIVVSNHGARQLDGVPSTIEALPGVVEAVGGRAEVLLDGGVRWGTDVLKALGLGARAVLVGRPVLWGLAVGGEAGVRRVLELLRDELSSAMALGGCTDLDSIEGTIAPAPRP